MSLAELVKTDPKRAFDLILQDVKVAGGIDVNEPVEPLLSGMSGMLGSMESWDIAHAAYVFDYIAGSNKDPRIRKFANDLATEYARRFADWLGFVFLNRANMTRASKPMKALQDSLGNWVEAIPEMLKDDKTKSLSDFIPSASKKFLNVKTIDAIGSKILKVVQREWADSFRTARAALNDLPISYNPRFKRYEIPKSKLTYPHRNKLRDLGFETNRHLDVWWTETLETAALRALPQAGKVQRRTEPAPQPTGDPAEWFFDKWLPTNIQRFSKVFNDFGRSAGIPYEFDFTLSGNNVEVSFKRNVKSIKEAVDELTARYGGADDRDGWMTAISAWKQLMSASGKAAIHAIDMANNLEHTHGAMMEHFPPGVRRWYPSFLDFKYTSQALQMVKRLRSEDLRVVAMELMPLHDRKQRLVIEDKSHRTPKGLALEISSQAGKQNKRKMLKGVKDRYPTMYDDVVENLEEKGLFLTASLTPHRIACRHLLTKHEARLSPQQRGWEKRKERDEQARYNILPEFQRAWDKLKKKFKGTPDQRAEKFMEYMEAHPEERDEILQDVADKDVARLVREQKREWKQQEQERKLREREQKKVEKLEKDCEKSQTRYEDAWYKEQERAHQQKNKLRTLQEKAEGVCQVCPTCDDFKEEVVPFA